LELTGLQVSYTYVKHSMAKIPSSASIDGVTF